MRRFEQRPNDRACRQAEHVCLQQRGQRPRLPRQPADDAGGVQEESGNEDVAGQPQPQGQHAGREAQREDRPDRPPRAGPIRGGVHYGKGEGGGADRGDPPLNDCGGAFQTPAIAIATRFTEDDPADRRYSEGGGGPGGRQRVISEPRGRSSLVTADMASDQHADSCRQPCDNVQQFRPRDLTEIPGGGRGARQYREPARGGGQSGKPIGQARRLPGQRDNRQSQ